MPENAEEGMDGRRYRAGIELYGRVMRYAEVDFGARGADAAPKLLRLGACDFDFDVAEALLDLAGPTHLDTVATAVREIFDGSRAETLRVAVHPWRATSFFSPIPEGTAPASRLEQFKQEAAMLADAAVSRPVRVKATPVRIEAGPDGRRSHWHHVLRLPESVHARFAHVAKPLGGDRHEGAHEFVDATGAAAAVVARLHEPSGEDDEPFALAVGAYGERAEFALCRGTTWYHGHFADVPARTDGAYFAAALLDRLGVAPGRVRRLFAYGDAAEPASAELVGAFLGLDAEPLNPLPAFGVNPPNADPLALSAYAPCVGALLR